MVALVDRSFNVQDVFLKHHVTVAMPLSQRERNNSPRGRLNKQNLFPGHAFTLRGPFGILKNLN